jgi:hypothetical protein
MTIDLDLQLDLGLDLDVFIDNLIALANCFNNLFTKTLI